MTRTVSLPQYQGPLDMLLALVRQNEFDILDLPIAEVTRQYLEYLSSAKECDLDLDSEWFYTASLLIHIKSRSLLPQAPEEAGPDPRTELARQLLDRQQLSGAAAFLENQWAALGGWPAPPPPDAPAAEEAPVFSGSLTLLQVLQLAQHAMASVNAAQQVEIPSDPVPIEQMSALLHRELGTLTPGSPLDFSRLWNVAPTAQHRSSLFLALLEGARTHSLDLEQAEPFAPIWIRPLYDAVR